MAKPQSSSGDGGSEEFQTFNKAHHETNFDFDEKYRKKKKKKKESEQGINTDEPSEDTK